MDESGKEHWAMIMTREETQVIWGRIMHSQFTGQVIPPELPNSELGFPDWALPLCELFRHHYVLEDSAFPSPFVSEGEPSGTLAEDQKIIREMEQAYLAAMAGDLKAIDNFLGVYELAQDANAEDGKKITGIRVETLQSTGRVIPGVVWSPVAKLDLKAYNSVEEEMLRKALMELEDLKTP